MPLSLHWGDRLTGASAALYHRPMPLSLHWGDRLTDARAVLYHRAMPLSLHWGDRLTDASAALYHRAMPLSLHWGDRLITCINSIQGLHGGVVDSLLDLRLTVRGSISDWEPVCRLTKFNKRQISLISLPFVMGTSWTIVEVNLCCASSVLRHSFLALTAGIHSTALRSELTWSSSNQLVSNQIHVI